MSNLSAKLDAIESHLDTLARTRSENPQFFALRQEAKQGLIAELRAALPAIRKLIEDEDRR